jgi:hypothetical protein
MIMDEKQAYENARKIIEERVGFIVHFLIYLFVNGVLFIINYRFSRGHWWFFFPLLFWGVGVFSHFLSVFVFSHSIKARWIEKKAQDLLKKNKNI